jgi:hypothetical protein
MCVKDGAECIKEALSNLFEQGLFHVFPKRSDRGKTQFFRGLPFAKRRLKTISLISTQSRVTDYAILLTVRVL